MLAHFTTSILFQKQHISAVRSFRPSLPFPFFSGFPTAPNQTHIWSVASQKPRISSCEVGNSFSARSLSGLWAPDAVVGPPTGCRGSGAAEIHQPVGESVSPGVALSSTAAVGLNCSVFGACTRHQLCVPPLFRLLAHSAHRRTTTSEAADLIPLRGWAEEQEAPASHPGCRSCWQETVVRKESLQTNTRAPTGCKPLSTRWKMQHKKSENELLRCCGGTNEVPSLSFFAFSGPFSPRRRATAAEPVGSVPNAEVTAWCVFAGTSDNIQERLWLRVLAHVL